MDPTQRLLRDFEESFNRGVDTGDFRRLLALLTDDAVLRGRGARRGPFRGRDAIAAAYRREPPTDKVELLDVHGPDEAGELRVGFSWLAVAHVRAGELRMVLRDGLIASIEVMD